MMDRARQNKSAARLRVVRGPGDLYAARSGDGCWIKIGFSTCLRDRLRALNYDFPGIGPFTLIGSTQSTYRVEMQLHRAMQPFHQIHIAAGKELYPASPGVLAVVKQLVAAPTLEPIEIDTLLAFRRWCRDQAARDENRNVALAARAPLFAEREEAQQRWLEGLMRRIAARNAGRVAA